MVFALLTIMEDEQYATIVNYLEKRVYPYGLAKGQKYVLPYA